MVNICIIVSFPILNVNLTPYQLFRRNKPYRYAKKLTRLGSLIPAIINSTYIVDSVENYIDEEITFEYLSQPSYIGDFSFIPIIRKVFQNLGKLIRLAKDIEILGVSEYTRIIKHRKSPA